jgi:hypothetical protein
MPQIPNAAGNEPPAAPLGVTWISNDLGAVRAGEDSTVNLELRNSGAATWRSRDGAGVRVSYHWLDGLGNPVVWDSPRTALPHPVAPGDVVALPLVLRAPMPPGEYVLAFDLVEEFQFWFSEIGLPMFEVPCTVEPRITERRLGVVIHPGPGDETETREALAQQDEPVVEERPAAVAHLVAGCLPEPDWSSRLLDAHAEGFAAVGGAVAPPARGGRREWSWLRPWQPAAARNPRFREALLLPSLVQGLEPSTVNGWPAFTHEAGLPQDQADTALFDGRIVVRLRPRSGRRRP